MFPLIPFFPLILVADAICFETIFTKGWCRYTPCGHVFHKQCCTELESEYNQRMDIRICGEGVNTNTKVEVVVVVMVWMKNAKCCQ